TPTTCGRRPWRPPSPCPCRTRSGARSSAIIPRGSTGWTLGTSPPWPGDVLHAVDVRTYSLVYLGQCLPLHQDSARDEVTYPYVAQHYVETARPGLRIATTIVFYESPYVDLEFKFDLAAR